MISILLVSIIVYTLNHKVFELAEGFLGDAQLESKVHSVSDDKRLMERLHLVDEGHIDDETLADACKDGCTFTKAFRDKALHLREIHADGCLLLVHKDDVGVVAITLHIDNLGAVETYEFVAGVDV